MLLNATSLTQHGKNSAKSMLLLECPQKKIEVMYQFDLHQFNADRAYFSHSCPLNLSHEQMDETDDFENPFLEKYLDRFTTQYDTYGSHSRYWWLEEIKSPKLQAALTLLSDEDKELLTLLFVEGYSQEECAVKLHSSQSAISRDYLRIIGIFTKNQKIRKKRVKNPLPMPRP